MDEWISVKDRLPDKDGNYLISCVLGNGQKLVLVRYFYQNCPEAFVLKEITHWMPLPKPAEIQI